MSLDDYINRQPIIPPKVNFEEQQSSLDVDYPPLDPGRTHLSASPASNRPANSTLPRFNLPFWTAQHSEDAVATITPLSADFVDLFVTSRTNKDRSAFLWSSKDLLGHQITSYVENVNYTNVVLAFQHNAGDPDGFTATFVNSDGTFVYRLVPYGYNSVTNKYECLDKEFGTGKTYPATVYDRTKTSMPLTEYRGSTDYIFILDFNDLRQYANFSGPVIDPRKISSIALDVIPVAHGLGRGAFVARIIDLGAGQCRMELGGVQDTAKLSAGDVLSGLLRYVSPSDQQLVRHTSWTVLSSVGFGTSARSVVVQGSMPGGYLDFRHLMARDLQQVSVISETDQTRSLGNFTLSGTGVKTIGKRTYTQAANGLAVVSDLDVDHNFQPKRLVESVHALGYRQDWALTLGSKSFYRGFSVLEKLGSSFFTMGEVFEWPVLYAGEAQLNGQYVVGRAPARGIDKLHDDVTSAWESNFAGLMAYNGTTLNSSVEKAGKPANGSYWWDLDTDVPGPALLNAIASMRGRTPHGIVWCLGDSDAAAIDAPGNRVPVPSIVRAKEATEKVFAHFRSLWGAALPIWIQEQAWGWAGTDPLNPTDPGTNVPIQRGAATYLRVRRTAYGDLLFQWKSYDIDPTQVSYKVEIYNPVKIGEVLHTLNISGTQQDEDYVYADWSVEDNGPIRALVDTGNDVWGGIRWRVVATSVLGTVPSITWSGLVPIDNSLVERVIVCGPNLYLGNFFTKVSDPTHGFNRRDLQAATVMRTEYALKAGLRRLKVMPIDVSDEDRGDEDEELENQKFGRILKDWWNLELGIPGASLVAAANKVAALGRPVAHVLFGQPGELELMRIKDPAEVFIEIGQLRQAHIDMLTFMRNIWSRPNLCMWLQGATSIWMGMPNVEPINVNAVHTLAYKRSQSALCLGSPDFFLGSYVPGGELPTSFQVDGLQRKYPLPSVYNVTAKELGESMALLIDRAVNDSDCPDMVLNVTPQFAFQGAGWYSLYGAPHNGQWSQTGKVDIANNRLAYVLLSQDAGFVYGTQTAVGVWGVAERPVSSVTLAKNGQNPVTVPLEFVEVLNSPYPGYTGQWRGVLNAPSFVMEADDKILVTIGALCDHDTGPGCDNPILVWTEGMEYGVQPTLATGQTGYINMWASQNSGLWEPSGAIGPNDFLGFVQITNGVNDPGGNVIYPNTSIVRWGKGDEGFTRAEITYRGETYTFPLTWFAAPSPQGAGVWQYAEAQEKINMSFGGSYELKFFGGIAGKRQIEVCSYCVGCDLEDTYADGLFSFSSGSVDNPGAMASILLYSFDYLEEIVKTGIDNGYEAILGAMQSLGQDSPHQGLIVPGTQYDLRSTLTSILSYVGTTGGFSAQFSKVMSTGAIVDAGFITYVESTEGIERSENIIGDPIITFGNGEGQVRQLMITNNVGVQGTVHKIDTPPLNRRLILDAECLLGIWIPQWCHYVSPPAEPGNDFNIGTVYFSAFESGTEALWDGVPWMAFRNGTPVDQVTWTSGQSFPLADNDVLRMYSYWEKKKFDAGEVVANTAFAAWHTLSDSDITFPVRVGLTDSGDHGVVNDLLFALVPLDGSGFQTWTNINDVVLDRPGMFVYQTRINSASNAFMSELNMRRQVTFTDAADKTAKFALDFGITLCRLNETYSYIEAPEIEQTSAGIRLINTYGRQGLTGFAKNNMTTIRAVNASDAMVIDSEIGAGVASWSQPTTQAGTSAYATWNINYTTIQTSTPSMTVPLRLAPPSQAYLDDGAEGIDAWLEASMRTIPIGSNPLQQQVQDTVGTHTAASGGVTTLTTFDRRVSRIGRTRNMTWGLQAPAGKKVKAWTLFDKVDDTAVNDDHNYTKTRYYDIWPEGSFTGFKGNYGGYGTYEENLSSSGLNCRESFREGSSYEISSEGGSSGAAYNPWDSISVPINWNSSGTPTAYFNAEGSTTVNEWRGPIPNNQTQMVLAANFAQGTTKRLVWGGGGFVFALKIVGKYEDPSNT